MISSALKTAGLAVLLVLPVASRVNGQAPPAPPAPSVAPAPPAPPAAPAPLAETHRQKVIVDGDRVTVWEDGEEPDLVVEGSEEDAHRPMRFHFGDHGRLSRAGDHHSDALKLTEKFTLRSPDVMWYEVTVEDPKGRKLTVRYTDLYKWVTSLEEFKDDPKNSNEKKLEAIQMAWYEEWQDRQG